MIAEGTPDSLTVINGPEDGTEFPITQREFLIGRDSSCMVNPRLDTAIEGVHGRGSAVADGYSIRNSGGTPIYVNGRRAGVIRSRIARAGDVLRIGHTDLILECSADGVASRSRGIALESDAAWALRHAASYSVRFLRLMARVTMRSLSKLYRNKFLILMIAGLLYWFVPEFRHWVIEMWWSVRGALGSLFG